MVGVQRVDTATGPLPSQDGPVGSVTRGNGSCQVTVWLHSASTGSVSVWIERKGPLTPALGQGQDPAAIDRPRG